METPLEISFRNLDHSDFIETLVREKVEKMERLFDGITSCHVFIEAPHKQHRKGNAYEVRLEVRVPGTELAVSKKPGDVNAHEDVNVALRDAFEAMERQLRKYRQKLARETKTHDSGPQGRVEEIDHARGFGEISTTDGRLVYFHRNAVVDGDFDRLSAGDPVELVVQGKESDKGPQASTVKPIRPMQYRAQR